MQYYPNLINQFYQVYFVTILQDILYVLTDSFHKGGFKMQAQILAYLLELIQSNKVR